MHFRVSTLELPKTLMKTVDRLKTHRFQCRQVKTEGVLKTVTKKSVIYRHFHQCFHQRILVWTIGENVLKIMGFQIKRNHCGQVETK